MIYGEWVHEVFRAFTQDPQNQRMGQFFMNDLRVRIPDLYEAISGTDDDPFFRDDLVPEFLAVCCYRWDSYTQAI